MASNKRGGLSKGEFKRAQAAKARPVVKKVSTQRSSSKPAPLYGAGPLLPGQKRVANSYGGDKNVPSLVGAGPLLPGQKRVPNSYTGDKPKSTPNLVNKNITKNTNKKSNRSLASKALGLLTGAGTAEASDGSGLETTTPSGNLTPIKVKTGLGRSLGYAKDIAADVIGKSIPGAGFFAQQIIKRTPDLGVTESLGLNKNLLQKDSGLAQSADSQPYVDSFNQEGNRQDFSPTVENIGQSRQNSNIIKNYGRSNPQPFENPRPFQGPQAPKNNYEQDYEKTLQDEMSPLNDYLNLASTPAPAGPANAPLVDTPFGTQRPASGRGSGLFGTGRGVGNPAGPEDEYIKELRKSLKGYGSQENDVMRQFKNLIKALDPTYDEYEKEGKDALNKQLWENNTQLASVMNANNTGDSEQRSQLLAGQQRENQGLLGDLLRKLALQKNEDIQGYKTKGVEAVNNIRDKKMSAQERIAGLIRQAQQENADRALATSKRGSGAGAAQSKSLQALLAKAAQMPSGGREWAQSMAGLYGVTPQQVGQYTRDNWEGGFKDNSQSKLQSLGNGYLLDPDTGDVFQAY